MALLIEHKALLVVYRALLIEYRALLLEYRALLRALLIGCTSSAGNGYFDRMYIHMG